MTDHAERLAHRDLALVSVISYGGHFEDESYTAGWEMGTLSTLLDERPRWIKVSMCIANVLQADLIAMQHGYDTQTVTIYGDRAVVVLQEMDRS